MLVESGDLQLPKPSPSYPNVDMSKYCPYHQNNGHTLEECFTVKDKVHNLNDKGDIMWPELKARLKAAQQGQQQIHQEPLFNYRVAQADAEIILSAARSELANIQCIRANSEQSPSSKEDLNPKAPSMPTLNSHVP